jgi:amidase
MGEVSTDIAFAGIAAQAELVRAREVSPVELVELYLDRIARIDRQLNSFRAVLAEQARAEAREAEAAVASGDERPLLGVPVAVKDNLDVTGEITALGSLAHGGRAREDAEVVERLRAAGAIVIGKTHMSELAIFPWTETIAFGHTRNPWDRGRTAGGSSGGSAVAVAAGLVGAASGSDGGGSIRIPASTCGLFGLKPQRDRVPLAPDADHWHGLSSGGVLTRTVRDTALYLDAVTDAGGFSEAAATPPRSLRVAVSLAPAGKVEVDDRVREAVERVAETLGSLGHRPARRDPAYGWIEPLFWPRWVRGIHDDVERLPHPDLLERRTRLLALAGRLTTPGAVRRARRAEAARARQINEVFDECDVLLTPTLPKPPGAIGRFDRKGVVGSLRGAAECVAFTRIWNVTGQPAASLPAPVTDGGVPIGVQLVARPEDEATILSLSAQLEAEFGWADLRPVVD